MAGDEIDECTLWIMQQMLSQPDRYWHLPDFSLEYLGTRLSRYGGYERDPILWNDRRGLRILADLVRTGWAATDEKGEGYRLTEAGVRSLTWLVRTKGRERGLIGTFLWEGGTAARQMYRSQHSRRVVLSSSGVGDPGADLDLMEARGFWWTLRHHGIAAVLAARVQRRAQRNGRV